MNDGYGNGDKTKNGNSTGGGRQLSGLEAIRAKERRKRRQLGSIAGQARVARGYKPGEGSKMAERLREKGR